MRCKNCKKKIENENLFRCPHCGKPIPKKKKRDLKETVSIGGFFAVSMIFVVLNFFSLFFECEFYDSATIIVGIVVYIIAVPFIFGNYKGLSRAVADCIAVALSVPFIVNWSICFAQKSDYLMNSVKAAVYYFSVLVVIVSVDIIMILKACGIIKGGNIAKWICLSLGAAEAIYSIVFYANSSVIKTFAMLIIACNTFMPGYIAYHIISRDSKSDLT